MKRTQVRAYTLIELLLVIAMLAIMVSATIAWITVPPREQLVATGDMEIETGLELFFAKLVGDAHNCSTAALVAGSGALWFKGAPGAGAVCYFIDAGHVLRRGMVAAGAAETTASLGAAPALLANVQKFGYARESPLAAAGGLARVTITVRTRDPQEPELVRTLEVNAGEAAR